MHSVVMESLEDYLAGSLEPAARRVVEAHLNTCGSCRRDVESMQEVSLMFTSLRSEEVFTPSPGFTARVVAQAGAQLRTPTFTSLFAFDLAFGRRLAFASLLTLAVLGSYLVSRETNYTPGPSAESVMAQDNGGAADGDRDRMLVTLTAYEQ